MNLCLSLPSLYSSALRLVLPLRTALIMHARLAAPSHASTGYLDLSLRVLQYSTMGESERVLFLSQFFSVIIQILTSGIPGGIPQFRVLQEASDLSSLAARTGIFVPRGLPVSIVMLCAHISNNFYLSYPGCGFKKLTFH